MKTAIVLGATGLTGRFLLARLVKDEGYSAVKLFSRSSNGYSHPKVEEHLVNFQEPEDFKELFTGDVLFCCIGTTKAKTPNEEIYKKIDHGIPVLAARLAKRNGIKKFMVVSALGANPGSRLFYNRTKGEMERDVLKQNISKTFIFQPSLISGKRKEKRTLEFLGKMVMRIINPLLVGPLKKYRSIDPDTIARAMIVVAAEGYRKVKIESDEIKKITKKENI